MPKNSRWKARNNDILRRFNDTYGQDDTRLESWQRLCRDVGVSEGRTIGKCKKSLKRIYINIVDFMAAQANGRAVEHFRSFRALQEYIQTNKDKTFPLAIAKTSPILKWMLITVY